MGESKQVDGNVRLSFWKKMTLSKGHHSQTGKE